MTPDRKKLLIIGLVAVVLIAAMGFVLAQKGSSDGAAPQQQAAAPSGPRQSQITETRTPEQKAAAESEIVIPPMFRECKEDADCEAFDISCSDCCQYAPLAKSHLEELTTRKELKCKGWKGGVCECYNPRSVPVCIKGECKLAMQREKTEEQKPDESPGTTPPRSEPVEP